MSVDIDERRVAQRDSVEPRRAPDGHIGVIDIGSNSVRLVVYDAPARLPVPIFNERVACRLGHGLVHTGRLDPDGVALAFNALTRFTNLAAEMGVERLELLGTAAIRDAEDGPEFVRRVAERFGRNITVLSGAEEARLSALGILSGLPEADGLVGDLGGGSVDLVALDHGRFGASATLPLGHLRLSEEAGGKVKKARAIVNERLASVDWLGQLKGRNLYAVGGAWRAVARISIGQSDYPLKVLDNYRLDASDAYDLTRVISRLSKSSLEGLDGVARRRADTLPHAALVLNRLIEITGPKALIFSGYSKREGQLFEMLPEDLKRQDPLLSACETLARRSGRFTIHGDETDAWMAPLFVSESPADKRLRQAASLLSDIGWTEHPDYRALHAFLRVLRYPIAGLSHRDRIVLAIAIHIRYAGNRRDPDVAEVRELLSAEDEHLATVMGLALRLAHVLTGGVPGLLPQANLIREDDRLILDLASNRDLFFSDAVERLFKVLADTIGVTGQII